ncbi:MAG: hypothetical protein VKL98_06250 [Cyanobacteriota bacterium]|nr:hypothetical protein [Cyanobacteriota bacterium]
MWAGFAFGKQPTPGPRPHQQKLRARDEPTLLEIARTQQQIKNLRPFAAETFSSSGAGTRQYNQPERLGSLYQEGRCWVQEVAALMRLPPYRPIFPSSSGTAGRINR